MRKYSINEIDELRRMCENKYLFGAYILLQNEYTSHSYNELHKATSVEEMVRTLMIAGVTPSKIRDEYGKK